MEPKIGVLDIGMGNVRSIINAVYEQGLDAIRVTTPSELDNITHLIIPGVGHFGYCSKLLSDTGFIKKLPCFIESKRPVLGICIGMQLLFSGSDESPGSDGLSIFSERFEKIQSSDFRVPHMGWNEVTWQKDHPVIEGVKSGMDFYFVHSYFLKENLKDGLSYTGYTQNFTSSVAKDNVIAFQFHPEKSQKNGLNLIENFCWWDGKC